MRPELEILKANTLVRFARATQCRGKHQRDQIHNSSVHQQLQSRDSKLNNSDVYSTTIYDKPCCTRS